MAGYDIIRQAILDKTNIRATYHGFVRELSPHVMGLKEDRQQVLSYQFGGDSESGLEPIGSVRNWRCMEIADMVDVSPMGGEWETVPVHTRPQVCVDTVDVAVTY